MSEAHSPRLRVLVRSQGAENRKDRPDFYDKTTCVAPLIVAAEAATPPVELVIVHDGPLPADRERLMATAGEADQREFGSSCESFRSTVAMATGRACNEADLVGFAEDDYLSRPDAFVRLTKATQRVTPADYFSMYVGELASRQPAAGNVVGLAGDSTSAAPADVAVDWVPAASSTSSFEVRVRQLRKDSGLLRVLPRPSRRRAFYVSARDLIRHLEVGALAPSGGWESVARQCDAWVATRRPGTRLPPATAAGPTSL